MANNSFFHITIRRLSIVSSALSISPLLNGCGEQRPKVYRVRIQCGLDALASAMDGFRAEMNELGYVEGKNISYDLQRTISDRLAAAEADVPLVEARVDSEPGRYTRFHMDLPADIGWSLPPN